ncbi:MAG: histidine kinase, partial [Gemmatirosa sp.]|nr:histidine kinase [Gemmatirosa sp.]
MTESSRTRESPRPIRSSALRWSAWLAWAALMLVLRLASLDDVGDPLTAVLASLPFVLVNTAVLAAAVRLSQRFPLGAGRIVAHGRVHALAALAYVGASAAIDALLRGRLPTPPALSLATLLFLGLVNYALLAGAAHTVEYARRVRRTEAAELRLRVGLEETGRRRAEAELRALKAELNPHFLGNALHAVSALLHSDPAAADRVLAHLGALLRETVARTATQEVTLEEEVAGLEPFLAIERARLGGGLTVEWDVAPDTLVARVPHLILQP